MVALSQIEVAMKPTTLVTLLLSLLLTSSLTAQSRNECSDRPSNESYSACQDRLHPNRTKSNAEKLTALLADPYAHHAPCTSLPTQSEAALRIQSEAASAKRHISQDEIKKAQNDALQSEIAGVASGSCWTEEGYRAYVAKLRAAIESEEDEATAKANAELRKQCGGTKIRIGMSERCVYKILGYPDHTNEDALSGKQLVYSNDLFVYIDRQGRVEDIQTTY